MNFVTSTTSVKHRNKLFRSAEESFQGCGLKLHLFLSTALKSPFIAHNYSAIIFRKRWLFGFLEGLITFRGSLGWSLVAYLKSLCTPGEKLELALRETSPPPPPPPPPPPHNHVSQKWEEPKNYFLRHSRAHEKPIIPKEISICFRAWGLLASRTFISHARTHDNSRFQFQNPLPHGEKQRVEVSPCYVIYDFMKIKFPS